MRNQLKSVAISLMLVGLPMQLIGCESVSAQSIQPRDNLLADEANVKNASYQEQKKNEIIKLRSNLVDGKNLVTYPQQEKIYRQLLTIYREIGDREFEIRTLVQLAELDSVRFRHGKAIETLKLAIQTAQSTGDRKLELGVLCSQIDFIDLYSYRLPMLVSAYLIRRDTKSINLDEHIQYLAGSDNYCLGFKERRGGGYFRSEFSILFSDLGDAYFDRKLYVQSISAYEKAIEGFRKETDKFSTYHRYDLLVSIGTTYKLMGQEVQSQIALDKAQSFYEQLLADDIKNFGKAGEILNPFINIAVTKNSDNLLNKVLRLYLDHLSKIPNNSNSRIDGYTIQYIGNAYARIGKFDLALTYYKKGLAEKNSTNSRQNFLHRIAQMYVRLNNDPEALKVYLLALKEFKKYRETKLPDYYREPASRNGVGLLIDVGNFYTRMGDKDKAKTFYKDAEEILSLGREIGWHGGPSGSISTLSDEDDLDKLLSTTSGDRRPEPTTQEMQK